MTNTNFQVVFGQNRPKMTMNISKSLGARNLELEWSVWATIWTSYSLGESLQYYWGYFENFEFFGLIRRLCGQKRPNLSEMSANQAEKSKSYIFFFSKFDTVTLRPITFQRIEIYTFLLPISMLLWCQL